MQKYFLFISLTVSVFACRDSIITSDSQALGRIVFESEYINHAWGYSHSGKYSGEDGKIFTYDHAKSNIQWKESSDGFYTEDELISKYHHFDTLRSMIPKDTVLWMYSLAISINPNTYSDTARIGADMGSNTNAIYLYRDDKKKYQRIVLNQEGDWRWRNTSESAIELTQWFRRMQ